MVLKQDFQQAPIGVMSTNYSHIREQPTQVVWLVKVKLNLPILYSQGRGHHNTQKNLPIFYSQGCGRLSFCLKDKSSLTIKSLHLQIPTDLRLTYLAP